MSNLRIGILTLLLLSVNGLALANDLFELKEKQAHWYAAIGMGDSVDYRAGPGQYDFIGGNGRIRQVTFSPIYNSSPLYFLGEIGYIWKNPFSSDDNDRYFPFMSLGIEYRHTTAVNFNASVEIGDVLETIPYGITQNSALLTWKIDFYRWFDSIMPYLNLGLGTSWNHTRQTSLQPIQDGGDLFLNTNSKTNTDWSYNVGVGLDFIVTSNFWLSLGYSYDNFGQLQLGSLLTIPPPPQDGAAPFNGSSTNLGNFHAHNIIFAARYLFG